MSTTDVLERLRNPMRALCGHLDYDATVGDLDDAADELARLRAENERLRDALKPFAVVAVEHSGDENEDGRLVSIEVGGAGSRWYVYSPNHLTVGHFRAARSALEDSCGT